jgi:deazaflavin-dependent oxidoreductase (nitroreductase family)
MPLPSIVAKVNRAITNRIISRFAGTIAPFAMVQHFGRRSGKPFRTPVMGFPAGDKMWFALTYGAEVDWVRNVLAAGRCVIEYRRSNIALISPVLIQGDPDNQPFPFVVRMILRLTHVSDFLNLEVARER